MSGVKRRTSEDTHVDSAVAMIEGGKEGGLREEM
jgi:hypothetical protein